MSATREPHDTDRGLRKVRRLTVVVDERANTDPDAAVAEQNAVAASDAPDRASVRAQGPLLAVSGLCGGAGATTLAYLIAAHAAREGPGPVLVADTGGPSGGLSCYSGVTAPRSLTDAAEYVASGLPTGQLVATTDDGLRVLAAGAAVHAGVRARRRRTAARSRPRAVRADRGRLRHAGPGGRPGGAREGVTRGLGAARHRQRRASRPARARGGKPMPVRPRADRRPPRRTCPQDGRARAQAAGGASSGRTRPVSQPSRPGSRSARPCARARRRCRCRRSRGHSAGERLVAPAGSHVARRPTRRRCPRIQRSQWVPAA